MKGDRISTRTKVHPRQRSLERLVEIGEAVTREVAAGLKPVLEKAAQSACELIGADYAAIYPYDPDRQLFYDLGNVVIWGLEEPRVPKEKPRQRGLAAIVRDIDELVVHDVDKGELSAVNFGQVRESGVDQARLLEFIQSEKFIQ
jgi:GAF domain-containing protein